MTQIFGVPYWKYIVDHKQFDNKILKDIEHNYSIDKNRNKWDGKSHLYSNIHHSNRDKGNSKFKEINYKTIVPLYKSIFDRFAKQLELDSDKIIEEMTSGDYDNLLDVFDKYFGSFVTLYR